MCRCATLRHADGCCSAVACRVFWLGANRPREVRRRQCRNRPVPKARASNFHAALAQLPRPRGDRYARYGLRLPQIRPAYCRPKTNARRCRCAARRVGASMDHHGNRRVAWPETDLTRWSGVAPPARHSIRPKRRLTGRSNDSRDAPLPQSAIPCGGQTIGRQGLRQRCQHR